MWGEGESEYTVTEIVDQREEEYVSEVDLEDQIEQENKQHQENMD